MILGLSAALAVDAKQVTITPVRGSAWFVGIDQLGYLLIHGDSLVAYNKDNQVENKEVLTNLHRIAVEESPTALPPVHATRTCAYSFDIVGRSGQPHQGICIIQQGNETKKVLVK